MRYLEHARTDELEQLSKVGRELHNTTTLRLRPKRQPTNLEYMY